MTDSGTGCGRWWRWTSCSSRCSRPASSTRAPGGTGGRWARSPGSWWCCSPRCTAPPLTVYLLGSWLGSRFPALRATHVGGHLWNDLIGWRYDPHLSPFHLASYLLIGAGFWLIAAAWRVLHQAARAGTLASTGPYAHVRHPQYGGLLLVMTGFLVQWPTIPTLAMFPVLVIVYARLARNEEREVAATPSPR